MALFKTAPRYLSGVNVFYGDDITKRDVQGELVVFAAPATKGPLTPVDIKSIDNIVSLYGKDNPLAKVAHQFWDGYTDSGRNYQLRLVAMRIGGIQSKITTSYGTILESVDAYTGLENDFAVYINNTSNTALQNIKIWSVPSKLLVYDYKGNINAGYWNVTASFTGTAATAVGTDLESNPSAAGLKISSLHLEDIVSKGSITAASLTSSSVSLTLIGDTSLVPSTGFIRLTDASGSYVKQYIAFNRATQVITLASSIGIDFPSTITITFVGSSVTFSDSQTNMSQRELYGAFKNALLQVETFTPDYIVPGGIAFDAVGSRVTTSTPADSTGALADNVSESSSAITVTSASKWPTTGLVDIVKTVSGVSFSDQHTYSNKVQVNSSYILVLDRPTYKVKTAISTGAVTTISLKVNTSDSFSKLRTSGQISVGDVVAKYNGVVFKTALDATTTDVALADHAILTVVGSVSSTAGVLADIVATKIAVAVTLGVVGTTNSVTTTYQGVVPYELGIGYVKEEYIGSQYNLTWSDEEFVQTGVSPDTFDKYNLAHFGYLFANFCNDAAIGYNTPLTAMNASVPTNPNSRLSIDTWIGKKATQVVYGGDINQVVAVTGTGTGLLGDAAMVGTGNFNRSSWASASTLTFPDPAYGLLLTDSGHIDGTALKDIYGKIVDLGKFILVGAGLLAFSHQGATLTYSDTCGTYALGLLAGTLKNEGISFKRVGVSSSVTIATVINRSLYNDLVGAGYVVVTREKRLGWVINNDHSVARKDSAYFLISTTRLVKDVIERKRDILVQYIGKTANRFIIEAAKTKLAESFSLDVASGYLNGYNFSLDLDNSATNIGKLFLKASINPPLEITQIDIDTVIDKSLTAQ